MVLGKPLFIFGGPKLFIKNGSIFKRGTFLVLGCWGSYSALVRIVGSVGLASIYRTSVQ